MSRVPSGPGVATFVGSPAQVTVLPPAENTPAGAETPSLTAPLVVPVVGSSLPQLALTSITGANKVKRAKAATAGIKEALPLVMKLLTKDGESFAEMKKGAPYFRKEGVERSLGLVESVGQGDLAPRAIVERRLRPGTKLAEQRIADIFKVSRTLVRQAFHQLSRDKLVSLEPSRGARVAEPGVKVVDLWGGYRDGMAVFTIVKGGAMLQAAIGGQKFSFVPR